MFPKTLDVFKERRILAFQACKQVRGQLTRNALISVKISFAVMKQIIMCQSSVSLLYPVISVGNKLLYIRHIKLTLYVPNTPACI